MLCIIYCILITWRYIINLNTIRILYLLHLTALALKCEVCSNMPGFPGAGNCDDSAKVTSMTCPVGFDRCMTVKGKFEVPSVGTLDIQLKNCSNSFIICDKNSDFNSK